MSQNWAPPPPPPSWSPPPPPPPPEVPNNLTLAIIAAVVSLLFCCLPHGLVAVYFATQVASKSAVGDIAGATSAAGNAKTWAMVSFGLSAVGLVISVLYLFLMVLGSLAR
jgi:hypothetical protein